MTNEARRAARQAAPPKKEIAVSITVTETPEGKLNLVASIPDEAAGTIALQLAEIAMNAMKAAMWETTGQLPPTQEFSRQ